MVVIRNPKKKSIGCTPRRWIIGLSLALALVFLIKVVDNQGSINISENTFWLQVYVLDGIGSGDSSSRTKIRGNNNQSSAQRQKYPLLPLKTEKVMALNYLESFKEGSFKRPLVFFHIPKTAGTAIEHAAGSSEQQVSWGSCAFNHKRKQTDCIYPKGGECKLNLLSCTADIGGLTCSILLLRNKSYVFLPRFN
jgi:hypothetical protein